MSGQALGSKRNFLKDLGIGRRTLVMGVLNVTPDSFSEGGRFFQVDVALAHALEMIEAGADIVDIGGESTRPGAQAVPAREELRRVLPVVEALRRASDAAISIDSRKSEVAREALRAGANMVNDIGGLQRDPDMAGVAAAHGAGVVIMHMQGAPETMQESPSYKDVVGEIKDFLQRGIEKALSAGIDRDMILIDPGIGFGKSFEHNIEILRRLREFADLGVSVMVGTSRKSFIGKILNVLPEERVIGTAATIALAIREGASVVRAHDVREAVEAAKVADAICREAS